MILFMMHIQALRTSTKDTPSPISLQYVSTFFFPSGIKQQCAICSMYNFLFLHIFYTCYLNFMKAFALNGVKTDITQPNIHEKA